MSDEMTDVRAVREFMLGRVDPAPQALSDLRERVVAGRRRDAPAEPRVRRRWLVPLVAAALALVVMAGVALVLGHDDGRSRPQFGSATKPPGAAVEGPLLDAGLTFEALRQAAAQSPPVTVPHGGLLYFRQDVLMFQLPPGAVPDGAQEQWIDPHGMITLKTLIGGKTPGPPPKGPPDADSVPRQRDDFARTGPGLDFPTPAWLAGLPTDPDLLGALLRPAAATQGSTMNDALFGVYVHLFNKLDPLLPVGVRTALLTLLQRLPGISVSAVTVDGAPIDAVRLTAGNSVNELFFDAGTAHAVGMEWFQPHRGVGTPQPGRSPTPTATDGPTRTSQARWTWAVVARLPG